MENKLDYTKQHMCPVYGKEIDPDLCYESLMCLNKMFRIESAPELEEIEDIEKSRQQCKDCEYSKL